jgi:single-stranded-DNA-specific exonuclease
MKELANLLNRAVEKIKATDSMIQVVSHLDADGLSSAAIIASVLIHLKKEFQITIIKMVKPEIVEMLEKRNPELVIFTDIGSGYLDVLKKIKADLIILDHHKVEGKPSENMIHINPEDYEINLSGAGTTYLLAKEILQNNSLAPLAVVGTIGDVNYSPNSKLFETPLIEAEMGLNLFGRFSRPLYKALEYSGIPSIDNSSKAIQFLSEIGIDAQKNGDWVTLSDLDERDTKKLADAIVMESLKYDKFKVKNIFNNNLQWSLTHVPT